MFDIRRISIALALGWLAPAVADAGPLNSWVYGTPTTYAANYRGYSGGYTAYYFPRGFSNDIPGSAAADPIYYQQPMAAAPIAQPPVALPPPPVTTQQVAPPAVVQPAPVAPGGCNSCQTRAYNYRPPTYSTTTMRVPVTVYRPVTAYSQVSGAPITSYQPCTTYRYQNRRVPRWNWPILSWLFGRRQPVYTQPPVVANYGACYPTATYPSTITSGPVMTSTPAVIDSNEGWAPSSPAPAAPLSTPAQPMPGYQPSSPAGGYNPQGTYSPRGTPNGGTPADSRPALRPDYDAADEETKGDDTQLNGASGASYYRTPIRRPYIPQATKPAASETKPISVAPQTPAEPRVRLQMIPDPDATSAEENELNAPQLIDPRDRTASQRRWGVVPASWPIAESAVKTVAPQPAPVAEEEEWDTSGWRPLRRSW